MNYIPRSLEPKFTKLSNFFKALLVTGPRQVGKTTMLKHMAQDRCYVSLDSQSARKLAQSDPVMFFQIHKPPIIIDEVQYAPELFSQIKILCDESEEKGRFWLTGSQRFDMMKLAGESLAGRLGIASLYSFSQSEKMGVSYHDNLDFTYSSLRDRQALVSQKNNAASVFGHIWTGGMPVLQLADADERQSYFDSYMETFVMKDLTELGGIRNVNKFMNFLTACAAMVGQQVNYRTLAEPAGISEPAAKDWLGILQGLGQIFLLQPYYNNALKRLTKRPKLYFTDTGFAAHLSQWMTKESLMVGAASGHFFENYVVMELLKNYSYSPLRYKLSYYRDSSKKEIDVFVEENNLIHPFEIKKTANPNHRDIKNFSVLDKASLQTGPGGIICLCEELVPIDQRNCYIPCNLI
jgi:predicted AAA+ superfamily ATPase